MATATAADDIEVGEQSPLIDRQFQDDDKPLEEIENFTRREKTVAGVSAVSFGASVAAMLLERNPLVYVSGMIGVGVAPYAAIQQQKITHVEALAETNKRVSQEVDQLKNENIKLNAQVEELGKSVSNLKLQKDKLDTIQSVQGTSLNELESQLEDSKKIYGRMQQNLQGDILNNLIDIALACDEDEDMLLSDEEIENAIQRLEKIHGLELDNEGIRKAVVANGRSLDGIMDLIRNLLKDDIPKESNLFKFVQKQ